MDILAGIESHSVLLKSSSFTNFRMTCQLQSEKANTAPCHYVQNIPTVILKQVGSHNPEG